MTSEREATMGTTTTNTRTATRRRLLGAFTAALALLVSAPEARAQEILLTGPLAGAPAVRKLRLYREGRFEVAPVVTFTLLDEYQRQILVGLRLNYNFTDWLSLGAWGAFGGTSESWPLRIRTGLSDEIQGVNRNRRELDPDGTTLARRLTKVNLGDDFKKQLGGIDWVVAPQITAVPFRGKLALFQSIYVDSELYFFVGPAFVGMSERGECSPEAAISCDMPESFKKKKRVAIAPTFGLGFSFFVNKWNAIGFEWRAMPFAWNTGGFDTAGGGKDNEFPDNAIDGDDRDFHFNQLLSVSYNFYFPQNYRVSE